MSLYDAQLGPLAARIAAEPDGVSIILVPATEQDVIAGRLAATLGRPHLVLDPVAPLPEVAGAVATFGPGPPQKLLGELNSRRQWITDRGSLVLVLGRGELRLFEKHAADVASITAILGPVAYEPRGDGGALDVQRRQLAERYRARFGTIDLRGFIRSEGEDASFALESIYQPLTGSSATKAAVSSDAVKIGRSASLASFLESQDAPVLVLGGPGSGKSSLLRWYALRASAEDRFLGLSRPIPIHISLAAYSLVPGLPGLREYVVDALLEENLSIVDSLGDERLQDQLVFLLDGLDEAGETIVRARAAAAISGLVRQFPRARIVITSRRSGLDEIELAADEITIEPLTAEAIRALLVAWCGLYERHRVGTDEAERRGREEGDQLAAEVLGSPPLRELASTPLLATIIAIVHRAGVRLPEHRAELYDHIIRVLVERWNQVRSGISHAGPPLRIGDAVRLLGPVAQEMIESDYEGAILEDELRSMLHRSLAEGAVRGVASADEALETFRHSLGLLVERAPGLYGFLHQTLVEFLAAHELVRTGGLELLCENPRDAFLSKWREVVLLSAGIVGQVQANDLRLGQIVGALVWSARHRRGKPSITVPSLLAGLVADDPSLTPPLVEAVLEELIPKWWFSRHYGFGGAIHVADEARLLARRIARGPWRGALRSRLAVVVGSLDVATLQETGLHTFGKIVDVLVDMDLEVVSLLRAAVEAALTSPPDHEFAGAWILYSGDLVQRDDETIWIRFRVTRGVARALKEPALAPLWQVNVYYDAYSDEEHRSSHRTDSTSEFQLISIDELEERSATCLLAVSRHLPAELTGEAPTHASLIFYPSRSRPAMLAALQRIEPDPVATVTSPA